MPLPRHHFHHLAGALAAGSMHDRDAILARAKSVLDELKKARWLESLIEQLHSEFADRPRPSRHLLADRMRRHEPFLRAWRAGKVHITLEPVPPEMAPAPGPPRSWVIPPVTTMHELATLLGMHPDDLGWLTSRGQTEHYLHHWRRKPKSGRFRLLEIPKPLLKLAQRVVLRRILDFIPPHEAAHGFRRGRSVRDFVHPHLRRSIVLRMDLLDFFPSIGAPRVRSFFRTAGYPDEIADLLTRLCTHAVSARLLADRPLDWTERKRLAAPHLPQGAPSSPALGNLCAFRLDCRLAGLARAAGATYTRYADDLLFSGDADFARQATRFTAAVGGILIEEGFQANHRKTRLLRPGQRQEAAGVVLNEKPNLRRSEIDRLKAILTNCQRHGPASQNRDGRDDFRAHLHGKVAWVRFLHPAHGEKLSNLFEQIDWDPE